MSNELELTDDAAAQLADKIVERHGDDIVAQLAEQQSDPRVSRRTIMATLGSGGLASLLTGSAMAADTSSGGTGAPGYSQDIHLDEILDPQGDPVADLDDTGDMVWQRGQQFPAVNADKALINSNQVYVQGVEPTSPSTGDVWIDNDG